MLSDPLHFAGSRTCHFPRAKNLAPMNPKRRLAPAACATVYGIEQGALVMELVEGADLKGPLPVDEALGIARQIAAGLEATHERGILHSDLIWNCCWRSLPFHLPTAEFSRKSRPKVPLLGELARS